MGRLAGKSAIVTGAGSGIGRASARPSLTPPQIQAILRRHRLVEVQATAFWLTGLSMRVWRIPDGRPVPSVERELASERGLSSVQLNFVYPALDDDAAPATPGLYALDKMHVVAALDVAGRQPVKPASPRSLSSAGRTRQIATCASGSSSAPARSARTKPRSAPGSSMRLRR